MRDKTCSIVRLHSEVAFYAFFQKKSSHPLKSIVKIKVRCHFSFRE